MNKFYKLVLSTVVVGLSLTSCNKDDDQPKEKGAFENGIFISNEGGLNGGASVSFIGNDVKVQQSIFKSINGRDLGSILQSITVEDEKAYLVVNNSHKVEVVNANTFKEEGVIADLKLPRYLIEAKGNLYLTQYNSFGGEKGSVKIIDPESFQIKSTVEVGVFPEGLLEVGNEVWVANSISNSISIIDIETGKVTSTLGLSTAEAPKQMILDAEGDVWILCSGNKNYGTGANTPSYLVEINPSTKEVKDEVKLSDDQHFSTLKVNEAGTLMYYGGGFGVKGIYSIFTVSPSVGSPIVEESFYGFGVYNDDYIYGCIPSFTGYSSVIKYDTTGKEISTYEVGIGPNGVVFNY